MPIYVVSYQHPDEDGWKQYVLPHIAWLQARLKDGSLLASGPQSDRVTKSALLIMCAASRKVLESLIATDPFAIQGLIENMTIDKWDPIFGTFNNLSSMPGHMQGD